MHKTHNCELDKLKKDKGWQNNIQKAYKHTWEAGTDVHDWIGLSSVLRPRQHSRPIGYMGVGFKVQILLKY